jgi:hypothetical protein
LEVKLISRTACVAVPLPFGNHQLIDDTRNSGNVTATLEVKPLVVLRADGPPNGGRAADHGDAKALNIGSPVPQAGPDSPSELRHVGRFGPRRAGGDQSDLRIGAKHDGRAPQSRSRMQPRRENLENRGAIVAREMSPTRAEHLTTTMWQPNREVKRQLRHSKEARFPVCSCIATKVG